MHLKFALIELVEFQGFKYYVVLMYYIIYYIEGDYMIYKWIYWTYSNFALIEPTEFQGLKYLYIIWHNEEHYVNYKQIYWTYYVI